MSEHNGWRLNRVVPVTAIIAILIYAFIATWWTASLSADVRQNKQTVQSRTSHSLRLGILEERYRVILRTLREIKVEVRAIKR